jgi:hypothetical protein
MAVFGAAVIRDKRLAFVVPLLSMLISDVFIELLYRSGYMNYGGFYSGVNFYDVQVLNYILLDVMTIVGFWERNLNWSRIAIATVSAPVLYFLLSNLFVWIGGGGYSRPHTFGGLMLCYEDALPFLRTSIVYTAMFSTILFGGYFLVQRFVVHRKQLA